MESLVLSKFWRNGAYEDGKVVGNNTEWQISKRRLQEDKARQLKQTNISYSLIPQVHFEIPPIA